MLGLLASDFYKLFHRKVFYICMILAVAFSAIGVFTLGYTVGAPYGMPDLDLKMFGYNGFMVLTQGASSVMLFAMITTVLFISNEFSNSTIRNVLIRGKNRFAVYASKLIVVFSMVTMYTLACCGASFASGCYLWGMGEPKQELLLHLAQGFGLFLLVSAAVYSFIAMLAFLIRSTGGALGTSIAATSFMGVILAGGQYLLLRWFNLKIDLNNYWITGYLGVNQGGVPSSEIPRILIVSLSYLVFSIAVGMITFWKREIK
ncbi:MAG: ABC transporter permease [Oscillospiraceae bacterium]|jgi:ABC-type transport system involved in multi-copper enzyme maturation permease subunit|nr:ABC transporter permease [Oscillospiraceae bacterium]